MQRYAGFSSFCGWLPKHAGLISSLTVDPRETTEGDRWVMMQRLQRALQASTARKPGQAAPPPLRLQEFTASGINVRPGVLSALAPTQLHRVILHFKQPLDELSPAACVALGKLRSLRELTITFDPLFLNSEQAFLPFEELAAGIGKLTSLTKLTLPYDDPAGMQQLPPSLRSLTLNLHPVADLPAGLQPPDVEAAVAAALANTQALDLDMQAVVAAALADPQVIDVQAALAAAPMFAHAVPAEWQQALAAAHPHVHFLPGDWQAALAAAPADAQLFALDMQPAFAAAPADLQFLLPDWQAAAGIAPNDMQEPVAGQPLDVQHLTTLQMLSIQPPKHSVSVVPVKLPGQLRSLQVCNGDVRLLGPHMPQHVELSFSRTSHLHILQDLSKQQQQPWSLELRASDHPGGFEPEAGAALAACTSLDTVVIGSLGSLPWSRHVAALQNLRRLELDSLARDKPWEEQDLLLLTALTALKHLAVLCDVSDKVAASLACDLTGLHHLEVNCEDFQTAGVLSAAAKLSSLRHLHLIVWSRDNAPPAWNGTEWVEDTTYRGEWWGGWDVSTAITPSVLDQLLPLTQLTYLHLPLGPACPKEARQQFLSSMPRLWRIDTAACKRPKSHEGR